MQQLAEVAGGVLAEQLVLDRHRLTVANGAPFGGEVAVPEEDQLLLQRPRRLHHAPDPPLPQLHEVLGVVLAALLEQLLPLLRAEPGQGPGVEDRQPFRWWNVHVRLAAVVHEEIDGLAEAQGMEFGDFFRRAAEAGPEQQVLRPGMVPGAVGERRQAPWETAGAAGGGPAAAGSAAGWSASARPARREKSREVLMVAPRTSWRAGV